MSDLQYELAKMAIGERIATEGPDHIIPSVEWMRVPGGWVISYWGQVHPDCEPVVTATAFVQEPMMIHQPKNKKGVGRKNA